MPSPSVALPESEIASTETQNSHRFALVSLTTLFFMWGFITALNDILIPYLKNLFELSYTQAMLVQFCFFGAYFIVSLPAGALVNRMGYQKGIVTGLIIAGLGCLLFYPAASFAVYDLFLLALFVLASGITILQVSANPYVSALGAPKTASSRLTLTQAFNSLGTTLAPYFGAILILSAMPEHSEVAQANSDNGYAVQFPYLVLSAMLLALAAVFAVIKLPKLSDHTNTVKKETHNGAWQHRHLVLGAVAIFVYVGAEVTIGSFLINFIGLENIAGLKEADAAQYVVYYFGGAMVGRFVGAAIMQKVAGNKVLLTNAICAALLLLVAIFSDGAAAMWAIVLIGLCNSIMFPTIFSLAITNLKQQTSQGSGMLCLAIVGGAIVPLLQGIIADSIGVQLAFLLPLLCYFYIAFYGFSGYRPTKLS